MCLALALVAAAAAWTLPARWRSLHPEVLRAAGQGSPTLIEVALQAGQQQRGGLATLLLEAAGTVGVGPTNDVRSILAYRASWPQEVQTLGGPDGALATLLAPLNPPAGTNQTTALDLFLPAPYRERLKPRLQESRSPGVQALLATRSLPTQQFVPAGQPGGQPFEAIVYLTATLYERERLSPELARELRELAEQSVADAGARVRLEQFYLNLLSLSRRLDWTSLSELTRKISSVAALDQFAGAVRANPQDLSLLYASALLSGEVGGVARHLTTYGPVGRQGLQTALRNGAGAVRWLSGQGQPVISGGAAPQFLSRAVAQAPQTWIWARTALFLVAALLGAVSLAAFAQVGVPESSSPRATGGGTLLLIALILGGFLVIASEPLPPRARTAPAPQARLDLGALTRSVSPATSSQPRKNIMEPTTLITLVIFGAIQVAVYVICVRKISEIMRLPEPPLVRLRLLENEENLFDAGLYVGIGGTAAALVMQVLQMVEANLLAAYSSNLMGIICVALVKIGHVRNARRHLILETQAAAERAAMSSAEAGGAPVTAANPFTYR